MIKGFRDFILRGNVVDLAVAVVIGTAFGAVVTSLVNDLIMPVVAAAIGKPDFGGLTFSVNDAVFRYGSFINAVVMFVLVAAAIYFIVVVPVNKVNEMRARGQAPAEPTVKQCPECLSAIPVAAKRCAFCASPQTTSDLPAEA